jgi:hypothetical protein
MTKQKEYFCITRVCRADLEGIGFDTSNVDDSTMTELADKMANAYLEEVYWIDLDIIAEHLDIPKRQQEESCTECGGEFFDGVCIDCHATRLYKFN